MHKQNKDPGRLLSLFLLFLTLARSFQRQSPGGVLSKMCSEKFRKVHKKAPAMTLFLSKVAGQLCKFTIKGRHIMCFSVNFNE